MPKYPFTMEEVESGLTYPPAFAGMNPVKRYNTPISPRDNYRLVYEHKLPVWIPVSSDQAFMTPRVDPDNIARNFCFEANRLTPEEQVGGRDRHNIDWVYVPSAGGSIVRPGNPTLTDANDWEKIIQFPDVDSWAWEEDSLANKDYIDRNRWLSITILTGFFERLISFMDFADAAVALIDEDQKTAVHGLFAELVKLYKKMIDNYAKYFGPDVISFHDDWGSQRAPFFSLNTVMEMIAPYVKQVVDHCHEHGIFYDQHSCGKNEKLVPAYIYTGADSWSGQNMNDKEWIYNNYGGQIILGMETGVAMDATPEEAYEGAKRFVEKYGPTYPEKPVFAGFFSQPDFAQGIYIESRKLFDSMR